MTTPVHNASSIPSTKRQRWRVILVVVQRDTHFCNGAKQSERHNGQAIVPNEEVGGGVIFIWCQHQAPVPAKRVSAGEWYWLWYDVIRDRLYCGAKIASRQWKRSRGGGGLFFTWCQQCQGWQQSVPAYRDEGLVCEAIASPCSFAFFSQFFCITACHTIVVFFD